MITFDIELVIYFPNMQIEAGPLLSQIDFPKDLRKLDRTKLKELSDELRQYIIDIVSVHGGHFGASLGVVELTVALHYVFNTPDDQLVWDVGHQAYGHKILTGRRKQFYTNRKYKGLSGFPNRQESPYDTFGVGHSSTSISAALGMAIADAIKGQNERQHIAVIGDGALSGGMAFEALNHAGISNTNLLVILNDNCMSIDPNVGALRDYLTNITTSTTFNKFRDDVWHILGKLPLGKNKSRDIAAKVETALKGMVARSSNLFEALNMRYFGPVDGHNIDKMVEILEDMKQIPGPKLLHVLTVKGKGFAQAEKEQTKWHAAPGIFDKVTGEIKKETKNTPQPPKYQEVFGQTLLELARKNEDIMAITPAMPSGSSLTYMMEEMPERALDVGICEQHAVTLSAGLATRGMRPFCTIYSTFLQRGYDQIIHDVAIQDLPVVFCLDRAGLVGKDGATHQGAYDIAYMRCIPNMIVSAPMNEPELRNLMFSAQLPNLQHPIAIRYPRGKGVTIDWKTPFEKIEIGKGRIIQEGQEIAILSYGHSGNFVLEASKTLAAEHIHPAHYDMRFAKPLDEELLHQIFNRFNKIITIEEGTQIGGFGSAVLEWVNHHHYQEKEINIMGIPDKVIHHGKPEEQRREAKIDAKAIIQQVKRMLHNALSIEETPHFHKT